LQQLIHHFVCRNTGRLIFAGLTPKLLQLRNVVLLKLSLVAPIAQSIAYDFAGRRIITRVNRTAYLRHHLGRQCDRNLFNGGRHISAPDCGMNYSYQRNSTRFFGKSHFTSRREQANIFACLIDRQCGRAL
jgi:hypothetical protein